MRCLFCLITTAGASLSLVCAACRAGSYSNTTGLHPSYTKKAKARLAPAPTTDCAHRKGLIPFCFVTLIIYCVTVGGGIRPMSREGQGRLTVHEASVYRVSAVADSSRRSLLMRHRFRDLDIAVGRLLTCCCAASRNRTRSCLLYFY